MEVWDLHLGGDSCHWRSSDFFSQAKISSSNLAGLFFTRGDFAVDWSGMEFDWLNTGANGAIEPFFVTRENCNKPRIKRMAQLSKRIKLAEIYKTMRKSQKKGRAGGDERRRKTRMFQ